MNHIANNTCNSYLGKSRVFDFMDRWLSSLDHQPQILCPLFDHEGDSQETERVRRITVIQVIDCALLHILRNDEDDDHPPTIVADKVLDVTSCNMDAYDDRDAHETPACNSPIAPRRKTTADATAFPTCPATVEDLKRKE